MAAGGKNIHRSALEALAVEGYRTGRLSESEIRHLFGFETDAGKDTQIVEPLQEFDRSQEGGAESLANSPRAPQLSRITDQHAMALGIVVQ